MSCDKEAGRLGLTHQQVHRSSSREFNALISNWMSEHRVMDADLLIWVNGVFDDKLDRELSRLRPIDRSDRSFHPRKGRRPRNSSG